MTDREKQIQDASQKHHDDVLHSRLGLAVEYTPWGGFAIGARWADSHPLPPTVSQEFLSQALAEVSAAICTPAEGYRADPQLLISDIRSMASRIRKLELAIKDHLKNNDCDCSSEESDGRSVTCFLHQALGGRIK